MKLKSEKKKESNQIKETGKANDLIYRLPTEILMLMFSYLTAKEKCRVARVSKKWKEISSSDTLWKKDCEQAHIDLRTRKTNESYKKFFARSEKYRVFYFAEMLEIKPDSGLESMQFGPLSNFFTNKEAAISYLEHERLYYGVPFLVVYKIKMTESEFKKSNLTKNTGAIDTEENPVYILDGTKPQSFKVTALYIRNHSSEKCFVKMEQEKKQRLPKQSDQTDKKLSFCRSM